MEKEYSEKIRLGKVFCGYIILNIFTAIIWGWICSKSEYLSNHNYLYVNYKNTLIYNLIIGFFLGTGYALFELPNSFIKRRLDILPGKRANSNLKYIFAILDQADSVFGCVLVVCFVYRMSFLMYLEYVLLGTITHLIINMLLYFAHLRKNLI